MVRIKICGITTLDDALMAVSEGADALGFVFAESPRRVSAERAKAIIEALPPFITTVGVFVNEDPRTVREIKENCGIRIVQFHGMETPGEVEPFFPFSIKAFRMKDEATLESANLYRAGAILLDAYDPAMAGGTGKTFNWQWAREAHRFGMPLIISGGLTIDRVQEAINLTEPYAVDVSSGVESSPGRKDPLKVRAFIEAARRIP